MIDIKKYKMLTPAISTLNLDEEIEVFLRNDEVEVVPPDCTDKIDLREVRGIKSKDFNLAFTNHTEDYIKKAQKREDFLQSFYYMFDFEVGEWVSKVCYI
jgi:hypothetical protein